LPNHVLDDQRLHEILLGSVVMVTQKEVEESQSDHPLARGLPDTPLASTLEESDQRVDALEDDE
tara:strand:- start:399 stop:590 length:192 start_codon:yes stop_codon:yes gene_type:complete